MINAVAALAMTFLGDNGTFLSIETKIALLPTTVPSGGTFVELMILQRCCFSSAIEMMQAAANIAINKIQHDANA